MFEIDLKSRKSISEQIVDNAKELIVSGIMVSGEKMPSIRDMAQELTVNPNTVQKAYRILESQGYIYTTSGRGTFVSDIEETKISSEELNLAKMDLKESINKLYYLGMKKDEAEKIIAEILEGRSTWK